MLLEQGLKRAVAAENAAHGCAVQRGKGDDGLRLHGMRGQKLFRPDHIVPAAEFVSAALEHTDAAEPKMLVETDTVVGQVFVGNDRLADAGVEVEQILRAGNIFERAVECLAETAAAQVSADIDRALCAMVVSLARDKIVRVGIAEQAACLILGGEIGIFLPDAFDAPPEFGGRGDGIFKGDRRFLHIGRVDAQQSLCIVRRDGAETKDGGESSLHLRCLSKPCTQSDLR